MHNLFGRRNFSAFAPRCCAARQGYPHEFSTIRPRFPQSYPQERELSSTVVSKTAAKCGKLRNLAVYRLVYVWISLWIMWKTLLTVSKTLQIYQISPAFDRVFRNFHILRRRITRRKSTGYPQGNEELGIRNEELGIIFSVEPRRQMPL